MAKISDLPYLVRVRLPPQWPEPRVFDASCSQANGWVAHLPDQAAADQMAQHLADMAELYADQVHGYLPDQGRRWPEAVLLAFPDSEIVQAPDAVHRQDENGFDVVY